MSYPITGEEEEWSTPPLIFNPLDQEFGFDLDPAAADWNHKAEDYFTKKQDGLQQHWYGSVFLNPPYGRQIHNWIKKAHDEWMRKAYQESRRSAVDLVVALLPARTDPRWFHDWIYKKAEIRFLPGRIYFERQDGSSGRSPWGSMIVIWR